MKRVELAATLHSVITAQLMMHLIRRARFLIAGSMLMLCLTAQGQTHLFEIYDERVKGASVTEPLSDELFGESISLYNGSTEFVITDIDLPGNNALPVRLGRRFKVESRKEMEVLGGFGSWDLDVPYIHGTFWDYWTHNLGGGGRCTQFGRPASYNGFDPEDFWSGNKIYLPGQGDQEILSIGNMDGPHARMTVPNDGHQYLLGTKSFHRIRCKASTANGFPGEGFIAVDTNGTKYTFDIGLHRYAGMMQKITNEHAPAQLHRNEVYLMVSRVEDRFGNWVRYDWNGEHLQAIVASDGRSITLAWVGRHIVSATAVSATAGDKTWQYTYYAPASGYYQQSANPLHHVTRPDGSRWTYEYSGGLEPTYPITDYDTSGPGCLPPFESYGVFGLTAHHPSGAVGQFRFGLIRHGRTGVPANACYRIFVSPIGNDIYKLAIPDYFDVFSILDKTITGPGVEPLNWQYGWEPAGYGRAVMDPTQPLPCRDCVESKTNMVRQPDGTWREYRFGVLWQGNDGQLLGTTTRDANERPVREEVTVYMSKDEASTMPFPEVYGWSGSADDGVPTEIRPVKFTSIIQDGWEFRSTNNAFDKFGRPTSITKASAPAP